MRQESSHRPKGFNTVHNVLHRVMGIQFDEISSFGAACQVSGPISFGRALRRGAISPGRSDYRNVKLARQYFMPTGCGSTPKPKLHHLRSTQSTEVMAGTRSACSSHLRSAFHLLAAGVVPRAELHLDRIAFHGDLNFPLAARQPFLGNSFTV